MSNASFTLPVTDWGADLDSCRDLSPDSVQCERVLHSTMQPLGLESQIRVRLRQCE